MKLVGLSGYARSGKDEAARVLVEEFGYERIAFADKLREVLYQLNPMIDMFRLYSATEPDGPPIYLQEVIDKYGWENYKESHFHVEIRRLLQRLGTEAGRQTLWDSIWVDAAFSGVKEDGKYVVTDMRFPNEFDAVKDRGGVTVRVNRVDVGPALGADGKIHASETSLDDHEFDEYLWNNYSLLHYQDIVRDFGRRNENRV